MSEVRSYSSDVGFTPAVKEIQTRKGSRATYAEVEAHGGWQTEVDENLAAFLAQHPHCEVYTGQRADK